MFSLVLPAYNEAENLEKCVEEVRKTLRGVKYEIIIAEDGSTDGTDKIAARLANKYRNITHLHHDKKLGRGLALRKAFEHAKGNEIGYIDVDLATNITHLKKLIKYAKKYDVVTGSRYLPGSKVKRPALRMYISRIYNLLVRVLIGCRIHDFQCGFKSFSKKFVKNEIFDIRETSWAWDTIILAVAVKKGYKVKEFPIEWEEKRKGKHSISLKRIFNDFKIHGIALLKLIIKFRFNLNIKL